MACTGTIIKHYFKGAVCKDVEKITIDHDADTMIYKIYFID